MGEILIWVAALLAVVVVLGGLAGRRRRARSAVPFDAIVGARAGDGHDVSAMATAAIATPVDSPRIDLWRVLDERVDLARFCPRLADDIEVKVFRLRWGNDYAIAYNPRDFKHYRMEVWQAEMLPSMDGTRTVSELVVERLETSGTIDADGVTELVLGLREHGYLSPTTANVEDALARNLDRAPGIVGMARRALRDLRVEWTGADRLVRIAYDRGLRLLFARPFASLAIAIAILGFAAFVRVATWGRFSIDRTEAPSEALILIVLGGVLTFAHELGHAIVITHHGRRIGGAGFMLYFGSPAFFVEASDSLMLDRGPRIQQAVMGPFFEFVLAGIASIVLFLFPDLDAAPLMYRFALVCYFVILLNLVPLLELDGYWILADAIQVPDLRQRSLQFTRHDLWHKLRIRDRFSLQEIGLAVYSILGLAFTVLCLVSAAYFWQLTFGEIVTELWAQGTATRVLLVVFVLLFAGPAIRGGITLIRAIARRVGAIVRGIRFRYETSWRVEAASLIDDLPAFADLPVDALNDLAGRVALRTVAAGEPIFRQGDRADAFYVVRKGLVVIEQEHPDTGDVEILATLSRAESFGELGLLRASPRSATARAAEESELFVVRKSAFDHLLASEIEAPDFAPTLQSLAELRALPPFAHLGIEPLKELLDHGSWVVAAPGDQLVRQGDPGDAFFAVADGQADVLRDGEQIARLQAGDHFGELALIDNAPRNATVAAVTPMRVFRLDREGFQRVVAEAFERGVLLPNTTRAAEH